MHRKCQNISEMAKNTPVTLFHFDPFNFATKYSDPLNIVMFTLSNAQNDDFIVEKG